MKDTLHNIEGILIPVIGEGFTKSAIRIQCRKMGIIPEELSRENIEELSERLREPVRLFAGPKAAIEIVNQIKELK